MHAISRPRRSWPGLTLSAFIAVTALIVIGQIMFLVRAGSGAFGLSPVVSLHGTPVQRLNQVAAQALGPSDRAVRRYSLAARRDATGRYVVNVRWAINDDLSQGTVGNGAVLDVYNLLRGLYGAGVPIQVIRLTGTFPASHGATARESVVLRLSMNRSEAALVARTGWDVLDPQTVWPLVERHYVNPAFQPISSD